MESLVERGFARLLRTRMQPVEVAKRLSREMEAQRTVAINRVLVPNRYVATLSAEDFDHFAAIQATLQKEMATYLMEYAEERSYTLPGSATVTFERDQNLRAGGLRVAARLEDPTEDEQAGTTPLLPTQVMPQPDVSLPVGRPSVSGRARIEMQGASCFIDRDVANLGRGLDNDVVVEDPRVSRHHARLQRGPRGWEIADLASTNGTFVNGTQIRQRQVNNGDTISLGGLEMKFHVDAAKR
ncbi:MAG: domain containing protein [Chloroflexi bacterium]|nr:domain containing protein [Chloroflexota bacterium]